MGYTTTSQRQHAQAAADVRSVCVLPEQRPEGKQQKPSLAARGIVAGNSGTGENRQRAGNVPASSSATSLSPRAPDLVASEEWLQQLQLAERGNQESNT